MTEAAFWRSKLILSELAVGHRQCRQAEQEQQVGQGRQQGRVGSRAGQAGRRDRGCGVGGG